MVRLKKKDTAKEEAKLKKAQARLPGPKRRPIRLSKEALDGVLDGVGGVGEVGGVGGLLRQRYVLGSNHKLSLANSPTAVGYHRCF